MIRSFATTLCSLLLLLPAVASAQLADMVAAQVFFPVATVAPGEEAQVSYNISNRGGAAGRFPFEIYLSEDQLLDAADELVHVGYVDGLAAYIQGQTVPSQTGSITFTVPMNIVGNKFYAILVVDRPNSDLVCDVGTGATAGVYGCIDEGRAAATEEANNRRVSNQLSIVKPDIAVKGNPTVTLPETGCFFGQPVTISYRLCNEGGGTARGFVDSVLLSPDPDLSLPHAGQGDPEVETSPVACFGLADGSECNNGAGICDQGICHLFCSGDITTSDCTNGLVCAEDPSLNYTVGKTCQNYLEKQGAPAGRNCRDYTRTVTIPEINEVTGRPFVEGYWYMGVITNSTFAVNEDNTGNNIKASSASFLCRHPDPDLAPISIIAPTRMAAGETVTIVRQVENLGIVAGTAKFRYVLSSNDTATDDDIMLPVVSTGGAGEVTVPAVSTDEQTDLVLVPSNVVPGDYRLGIVVDGERALRELDDSNNVYVMPGFVRVEKAALRVVTRTLPAATVGAYYAQHLVAAGGVAAYQWTADMLPNGLTLTSDGFLSGTPQEPGDYAFTVTVKSGQVTAWETLPLRVLEPMGPLVITTPSLPPAVAGTTYAARITAQGGKPFSGAGEPPYKCRRVGGTLFGLAVNENCTISGPPQGTDPQTFTVEVWDALGNRATKDFTIVVLRDADLRINAQRWEEAAAGSEYGTRCTVRASGGDSKYTWSVEQTGQNRLPTGMSFFYRYYDAPVPFNPEEDAPGLTEACLTGKPTECGSFIVPVRVSDGSGQSHVADLPLNVTCASANLVEEQIGPMKRGDAVDVQLTAEADGNVRFRLFYGRFPSGVSMDETGKVTGTIDRDADPGTYNLIIELSSDTGAHALEPLSFIVEPDVKELPKPGPGGGDSKCSTAGGGAGMLPFAVVILALAAAALRRRAAVPARIFSFVAVVALAGGAEAQVHNHGYMATAAFGHPYQELQGAIRSSAHSDKDWSSGSDMWVVPMPAGFTFRYFGSTYSHIGISGNGGLVPYNTAAPTGSTYYVPTTNKGFPDTAAPAGIIAPWWDDFARSSTLSPHPGGLFYKVEGVYPNRVFKVQWKNLTHYICSSSSTYNHCNTTRTYSFQAWIYEASVGFNSSIVFLYDTPIGPDGTPWAGWASAYRSTSTTSLPSASIGLESVDQTKGLTILACTPNCTFDQHWPDQKAILITQKADLRTTAVNGDPMGWAGVPMDVSATVQNIGLLGSGEFKVEFFGSTDARLDSSDPSLGLATATNTLAPNGTATFTGRVRLPANLQKGSYYIIAKADPDRAIDEDFLDNNVAVFGPFVIGDAAADATVDAIVIPDTATIGSSFTLDWTVRNRGNLAMSDVPYVVVLSDNDVIGATDLRVASGTFDVDLLSTAPVSTQVTIPASVQAGQYYVGVILDPDDIVPEVDEFNNSGVSATRMTTVGGPLQVLTSELPAAQIGSPYCTELRAAGGNGDYTWTVATGSELPPGLALDRRSARTTLLCGVPAALGSFEFGLQVTSGSASKSGSLSLVVDTSGAELTVVTLELPTGIFNAPYAGQLMATGGTPPYEWRLTGGKLPTGLAVSKNGVVSGTPKAAGSFDITVEVTDATGFVAPRSVELVISEPTRVSCLTTELAPTPVGASVRTRLVAAGGSGSYVWDSIEVRRLATATDAGGKLDTDTPPGLTLASNGEVSGTANAAGRYLWSVEVRDGVVREQCLVLLDVTYEQGLTVTTRTLSDADVGVPYEAQLEASGGSGRTWRLADDSELPRGLQLSEAGIISGTLDASLLQGAERKTFGFVVEVRDDANRSGVAALSITLRRSKPVYQAPPSGSDESGGCQAGAGVPGMLGIAMALGLVSRRRRN